MDENKHTPGPWRWSDEDGWGYSTLVNSADIPILEINLSWSPEPGEGLDGQSLDVSEADARLIAAAPDLFEALEELVRWVRPSGYAPRRYDDAMALARKAIAKATTVTPTEREEKI